MNTPYNFKKMITIGSATFALLAAPLAVTAVTGFDLGVISAAHAADDGSASKKGSGNKGKAGSQKGVQGKGDSASKKVFRVPEASEDSDRPLWAGVKGGKNSGGGKPAGAGSKKGDLFGDMVVLLRDANGAPILVNGLVQVIAYVYDTNGNLVPLKDASGNQMTIPYNAEGDLETSINGVPVYSAEVELGRLSVGRAPTKVLTHSLDEALSKLTSGTVTLDSTGRLMVDGVTIDSPLENLALYEAYMAKTLPTAVMDVLNNPTLKFNPASLLAAASDKYGSISVDTVIYMNSILGVNSGTTYYDFSSTNYDRYTTWINATATVLVLQPNGSYVPTVVNLYDAVFNSTNWTDPTAVGGADDFATAADDYRAVIEFVHDNAVR